MKRETRDTRDVCGVTRETREVSLHLPARPGTVWCHHICLSGPARVTSQMCMRIDKSTVYAYRLGASTGVTGAAHDRRDWCST